MKDHGTQVDGLRFQTVPFHYLLNVLRSIPEGPARTSFTTRAPTRSDSTSPENQVYARFREILR
jgi:hypothetical protein